MCTRLSRFAVFVVLVSASARTATQTAGVDKQTVRETLQLIPADTDALHVVDIYGARRLLEEHVAGTHDLELLARHAFVEDAFGAGAGKAYAAQLDLLVQDRVPQMELVELCRRGLLVTLRDEDLKTAKLFADKLASAGDLTGQSLLNTQAPAASSTFELFGGVDAFNFLIFNGGKNTAQHILIDYSRLVVRMIPQSHDELPQEQWQVFSAGIHEYFQIVAALAAIGERKNNHIEIRLGLTNKADEQRTENVFGILGLKLNSNKAGLLVHSAERKSEAKKQDVLAALAIDDADIQQTLAKGKSYALEIPIDRVAVFPSFEFWQQFFGGHARYPGGILEALVTDPHAAPLFYALNSMDRGTATMFVRSPSLMTLAEHHASALSLYAPALTVRGTAAEVPGGLEAVSTWETFTSVNPANAIPFFDNLLRKDDGRLIAFFYSIAQLDWVHQQFFTKSPERLRRFYDLFCESADMRRGAGRRLQSGTFVDFLREVPLNYELSVDFPGSPAVWMIAGGRDTSLFSVAGVNRTIKNCAGPDSEDEILIRLAKSAYKSGGEQSELANFIATVHIEEQRTKPLSTEAALRLAQGYSAYGDLYAYFAELGDLEAEDYQKLFSLADRFSSFHPVSANIRLGQLHSFLAMLGLLHERGTVPEKELVALYRKGLDRYLAASTAVAWTIASLDTIRDLAALEAPSSSPIDAAIQDLVLGKSASEWRKEQFAQVLELQKAPSLDALFAIRAALRQLLTNPTSIDDVQRQIASLPVLPVPKEWHQLGNRKKCLEVFETGHITSVAAKIREKQGKHELNEAASENLADDILANLQPWVELAMTGRIYARYLETSDLLVANDPMLLRKHEFVHFCGSGRSQYFTSSDLHVENTGEGSYFTGGLADFGISAGRARSIGNHLSGAREAFATAIFASIRTTDWQPLTPLALRSFGATVRLGRECIVESAVSPSVRQTLEQEILGLVSLNRRRSLLDALDEHDWPTVWQSVSVSDLYFLGQALLEKPANSGPLEGFWKVPTVAAMREVAMREKHVHMLGSAALDLNGCAQPRLRRYGPYEDYERYLMPSRMAERTAELKLQLAWIADSNAWNPASLESMSTAAADALLKSIHPRDEYDWSAMIAAFRKLTAENLESLSRQAQEK